MKAHGSALGCADSDRSAFRFPANGHTKPELLLGLCLQIRVVFLSRAAGAIVSLANG